MSKIDQKIWRKLIKPIYLKRTRTNHFWLTTALATITILLATTSVCLAGTYSFPFKGDDIGPKERVYTSSHPRTVKGKVIIQGEGYDIWILRYLGDKTWSDLKEESITNPNEQQVAYGRNVYAIADGKIIGCWRNAPENPRPVISTDDTDPETGDMGADRKWLHPDFNNMRIPGGGNMLFVEHTDGTIALYAHFKPGSIPETLCRINDSLFPNPMSLEVGDQYVKDRYSNLPTSQQVSVKRGQLIGKVGNSGNSGGPHLHLHVEKGSSPEVMIFKEGIAKPYSPGSTDIIGNWRSFANQQIPEKRTLVRPPRATKYRMMDFESYRFGGKQNYVGIMKPASYNPRALFKSDWNEFLKDWKKIEDEGYRMKDLEIYRQGRGFGYAGIFEPGNYNPVALFKNDWNEFLTGWKEIEKKGYRMKDLEIYQQGRGLGYAGIFEPASYNPVALFKDDWNEFLKGWEEIEKKGYRMKDLEIYQQGRGFSYAGIFEPGNYNPVALFKSDWNEFLKGWQEIEKKGYRMKDLEIYQQGRGLGYAGIFEPDSYNPVALFKNDWNEFLIGWQHFE